MNRYDIFNGDADGICAVHQWRLSHPASAVLITGVKRDIQLLSRVSAMAGDDVTVFDISLDSNRADVLRLLQAGVSIRYFDHHFAGDPIEHPRLSTSIVTAPDTCSSLLVDAALGGRHRAWAVVAAFGDNLHESARNAAAPLDLPEAALADLAELGELINYNAYGDSEADLHFAPAELYRAMAPFADPHAFIVEAPAFTRLRRGFAEDFAHADSVAPCLGSATAAAWLLPDAAWSRRVVGVFSNRLANQFPDRAPSVIVPNASATRTVSVRSPKTRRIDADALCRQFPSGGGRKGAAGINHLPPDGMDAFLAAFSAHFA